MRISFDMNLIEDKYKHQKAYYQRNKETLAIKEKIYRSKPEVRERNKITRKKYRLNNKEKLKEQKKNYYQNNKEKHIEYRARHKLKYPEKFLPKIKAINNCLWCRQETTNLYCSKNCKEKVKIYRKRRLPLFVWRFYSKYKIYKLIYEKIPKYINHGIKIPFKKLKNKIKKLPKIYTKINMYFKHNQFYFEKTKICGHWVFYKTKGTKRSIYFKRNFCSDRCQNIEKQKIIENKKQRNIALWGTEYRPDAETRKKITNKKHAEWERKRRVEDPAFKLIKRMRLRTKKVLGVSYRRNTRKTSIYERLCVESGQELREHIESLWEPGMNWENYGKQDGWVIDHKIPLKYYKNNFDLVNDIEIQKKAFGKNNLQPLWWLDNAKKSAKLDYEME